MKIFSIIPFVAGDCVCRDWHGCIMAQSIVGLDNLQPYKFSECSKNDYFNSLRSGSGMCLMNKPNEVGEVVVGPFPYPSTIVHTNENPNLLQNL